MGNFRNIIKRIFELTGPVAFFPVVLVSQNGKGKNGKYHKEVDKYPLPESALYNHGFQFAMVKNYFLFSPFI